MDYKKLKEQWLAEENASFEGWDFSRLDDRWEHEPLSWDYGILVRKFLGIENILLDMGIGGGEYLLSLNHPYHLTFATEAYLPNFELCKRNIVPLGIDVRQVFDDSILPFESQMFDIVINRHEAFNVGEVKRVLKPNGIFITQQVGDENSAELSKKLLPNYTKPISPHNLTSNVELLVNNGFEIIYQDEAFPKTKFRDVGAVVYFAKIIEWEFPEFSVLKCFNELCTLQKQLELQSFIENGEHRFAVVARNPSEPKE